MTTIQFLGAADTVTGSRYLVETDHARVLVDCGLFQGWKKLRQRNWDRLPFDPSTLDAVVFTHAHIDHTGYFPKLCASGFAGAAYCTPGTASLLGILFAASELAPTRVFVTHGEPAAADAFRRRLGEELGWNAVVPDDGSSWRV